MADKWNYAGPIWSSQKFPLFKIQHDDALYVIAILREHEHKIFEILSVSAAIAEESDNFASKCAQSWLTKSKNISKIQQDILK
jgi:hypothetical protein